MDIKTLFDRIGLNGTWWQWRVLRWQQAFADWRSARRDDVRHVSYRHRFCRECGAIVPAGDAQCGRCGAPAPSASAEFARRVLGLVAPRWPLVSSLLLVSNFAALLVMMASFGARQLWMPESAVLLRMGALNPYVVHAAGEYWRLFTYAYLHAGLLHIGFNMFALSQVGAALESHIGGRRFFALYTLSLLGGAMADLLIRGPVILNVVGASGALFGLIGFGLSYAHFRGGPAGRAQRGFFLHWAVYGFAFGYVIGADNICHLGGFVAGAIVGWVVEREQRSTRWAEGLWTMASFLLAAATIAAFVWSVAAGRGLF